MVDCLGKGLACEIVNPIGRCIKAHHDSAVLHDHEVENVGASPCPFQKHGRDGSGEGFRLAAFVSERLHGFILFQFLFGQYQSRESSMRFFFVCQFTFGKEGIKLLLG